MQTVQTVQRSALCRSRRELSNADLLAKFGFDTAENEPLSFKFARSLRIIIIDPPGSAQEKRGEDLGSVRNRNIDVG